MEYKTIGKAKTSYIAGQVVLQGFGNVYDIVDLKNDIMVDGVFDESLSKKSQVPMLLEHKLSQPIGRWIECKTNILSNNLSTDLYSTVLNQAARNHVCKYSLKDDNRLPRQKMHENASNVKASLLKASLLKGLQVKGLLLTNLHWGKVAHNLLLSGELLGLSVGYEVKEAYIREDNVRVITKANLMEISLVMQPANQKSYIQDILLTNIRQANSTRF